MTDPNGGRSTGFARRSTAAGPVLARRSHRATDQLERTAADSALRLLAIERDTVIGIDRLPFDASGKPEP